MRSSLSAGPFIQVNCGALPEHLIESELFGYEAGAFTGANRKGKPGFFQLADGGTLFLDEVGEIPLHVQVKLLHAIQHSAFYRVGGTTPIKVRVRIIAATNRNLEHAVSIGQFREDLFYRLNVLRIQIPPLRERREDISELISALLPQICSRIENRQVKVSRDALYTLQSYSYPGNVRELENILERAVNLCEDGEIKKDHLLMEGVKEANQFSSEYDLIRPLKEVVQEAEKKEIIKAIARTEGDRDLALKKLGIGKSSFYEKLKKYNIRH
jgi:transcriptional regulator with PAS, ATPase and Fis domain